MPTTQPFSDKPKLQTLLAGMVNLFELPKTLICRTASVDAVSGSPAHYWQCSSQPTNAINTKSVSILTKEGLILCLVDERFICADKILSITRNYSTVSALSPREVLQNLCAELRSWSEQFTEPDEYWNAAFFIVQPSGVASLTIGKAQVRSVDNRLRLRNVLSVGSFKDFLQERVKSRLEAKAIGEELYCAEDWSWQNGEHRLVCRFEERTIQGMMRIVALASDIWLPTDVEAITRAGLERRGGLKAAIEAMRTAFIAIGEQPRGSLAILEIVPQELDSPDADDALDFINKLSRSLKALKSASILGVGVGKLAVISLVVGLVVYGAWNVYQNQILNKTPSADSVTFSSQRNKSRIQQSQALKDDTTHAALQVNDTDGNDADTIGLYSLPNTPNASKTTILAFEKSSRTIIPILLKTPPHLAPKGVSASNVASKIRVEIAGPQRVSKYRIETDTVKRQLPPNTTRLNIVIEEPLEKGRYTVNWKYADEQLSSSASVSVNVVEIPQTSTNTNMKDRSASALFTATSRTFYFGTQMVMSNKQLALLRARTENFLGGNLEGVLPNMSFAYRFISRFGDTSATHYFPFDEQNKRGIQYGQFISSSMATIETWINYRYPNGTNAVFGHTNRNVMQMPPSILSDKAKITWAYKPRIGGKSAEYRPNDIEVTISGLFIDVSDVPVDNDESGLQPVYATLNNTRVSLIPLVREQGQSVRLSLAEAKLKHSLFLAGVSGVALYGVIRVYNSDDQEIVPESRDEMLSILPISSTFDNGRYTCKVLIKNLPPKPRDDEWQLMGEIVINPNATITNPLNGAISPETIDMDTFIPISIVYK